MFHNIFHQDDPVIETVGQDFFANLGDDVSLPCRVPNLGSWIRVWKQGSRAIAVDKLLIRLDQRLSLSDAGDLQIRNFDSEDVGEYDCEIADTDTPLYIRHSLNVIVPPAVNIVPSKDEIVVVEV